VQSLADDTLKHDAFTGKAHHFPRFLVDNLFYSLKDFIFATAVDRFFKVKQQSSIPASLIKSCQNFLIGFYLNNLAWLEVEGFTWGLSQFSAAKRVRTTANKALKPVIDPQLRAVCDPKIQPAFQRKVKQRTKDLKQGYIARSNVLDILPEVPPREGSRGF
jgi:hypothetical protein